jgi:hypothetical protein
VFGGTLLASKPGAIANREMDMDIKIDVVIRFITPPLISEQDIMSR